MTLAFKVYFKRIEVRGAENIPTDGPVLLACNHPSSFMEGCLVSCFQDRELHYLVRGDVFEIKWLKPLLIATNQIPIFRFRDGFSSMKKNKETFTVTYDVLKSGAAVIIYPEGSTALIKQLRPLQKGLAKMSMGALEKYPDMPLKILPVGVNYSDVLKLRSSVTVSIGQPVDAADFKNEIEEDKHAGIKKMTDFVFEMMKPHVLHLDQAKDEVQDALLVASGYHNTDFYGGVKHHDEVTSKEFAMAGILNEMDSSEIEEVKRSFPMIWPKRLDLMVFRRNSIFTILGLILLTPFALLGFLLNFIPFYIGKYFGEKKIKALEFKSAVRIAVWLLLEILQSLAVLCVGLALGFGWWSLLALLIPVPGIFTLWWYDLYHRLRANSQNNRKSLNQIEALVGQLMSRGH